MSYYKTDKNASDGVDDAGEQHTTESTGTTGRLLTDGGEDKDEDKDVDDFTSLIDGIDEHTATLTQKLKKAERDGSIEGKISAIRDFLREFAERSRSSHPSAREAVVNTAYDVQVESGGARPFNKNALFNEYDEYARKSSGVPDLGELFENGVDHIEKYDSDSHEQRMFEVYFEGYPKPLQIPAPDLSSVDKVSNIFMSTFHVSPDFHVQGDDRKREWHSILNRFFKNPIEVHDVPSAAALALNEMVSAINAKPAYLEAKHAVQEGGVLIAPPRDNDTGVPLGEIGVDYSAEECPCLWVHSKLIHSVLEEYNLATYDFEPILRKKGIKLCNSHNLTSSDKFWGLNRIPDSEYDDGELEDGAAALELGGVHESEIVTPEQYEEEAFTSSSTEDEDELDGDADDTENPVDEVAELFGEGGDPEPDLDSLPGGPRELSDADDATPSDTPPDEDESDPRGDEEL